MCVVNKLYSQPLEGVTLRRCDARRTIERIIPYVSYRSVPYCRHGELLLPAALAISSPSLGINPCSKSSSLGRIIVNCCGTGSGTGVSFSHIVWYGTGTSTEVSFSHIVWYGTGTSTSTISWYGTAANIRHICTVWYGTAAKIHHICNSCVVLQFPFTPRIYVTAHSQCEVSSKTTVPI